MRAFPLYPAIIGGWIAGTLDIGAAALINNVGIGVILHSIAAGLIGKRAVSGGLAVEALGLGLQWAMSILIALICGAASLKEPALARRWILAGLAYGVVTFVVMNFVVLPLSAIGRFPHFKPLSAIENLGAMLIFGLVIAYAIRDRAVAAPGSNIADAALG